MQRLKAKHFLLFNTFPNLKKGQQLDDENRKIDGLMATAIKNQVFTVNTNDEVDIIEFCRWASNKMITKKSPYFKFPWLKDCLNLPPKPAKAIIATGGALVTIENNILPSDYKTCREYLITVLTKNSELEKENKQLLEEVIKLRSKKQQQIADGRKAAAMQWKN